MSPATATLTADDLWVHRRGPTTEVSVRVRCDVGLAGWPADHRLVVRVHDGADATPTSAAAVVPVLTMVAAAAGADVVLDAPVDRTGLAGARLAGERFAGWFGLRPPVLHATTEPADATGAARAAGSAGARALFFSRGLDSMAVLCAATAAGSAPDVLVALDWVDAPYASPGHDAVLASTRAAAAQRGLPVVRVSTNARDLTDPLVGWGRAFGPVLASVGLALEGLATSVGIASSFPARHAEPHGSHPELDGLWSTSAVTIEHRNDVPGGRIDKARVVAGDRWACRWLKVCWVRAGDGNCGVCHKCLLTQSDFLAAGAPDAVAAVFDAAVTPAAVDLVTPGLPAVGLVAEVVAGLRAAAGSDPATAALADAWQRAGDRAVATPAAPAGHAGVAP